MLENAKYGITAVRYAGAEVIGAMMGLIDDSETCWDFSPMPARISEVVDKLMEGDTVISLFPGHDGRLSAGPIVLVDVLPEGTETLALDDEQSGRCLRDLPRF